MSAIGRERYRDLIEAADTIMEMGQSAQAIVGNFKRLQDQCSRVDEFTAAEVNTYVRSLRQCMIA
jgi:hypothetical protein